jgi:plastocyanin
VDQQGFSAAQRDASTAGLESGDLASSHTWKFIARKKGEIDYICRLHLVMRGVVVVK